jgi:hypothetical protein
MDIVFDFHLDGWMVVLGTSWLHCLAGHIVWFLLCFEDETCEGGWNVVYLGR